VLAEVHWDGSLIRPTVDDGGKGLVLMRPRNWTSFAVLSCLLAVTALALVTAADEVTPPPSATSSSTR